MAPFVVTIAADKNGKIYMTKNYETHEKIIADLKSKGLWLEW